jgi:hypothetical protein
MQHGCYRESGRRQTIAGMEIPADLCLQLITILDTEAPQITCPENLYLECGNELPVTTALVTDNCNEFTTTYSDHICSSSGFTGDYAFENWTETEPLNNGDVTTSDDAVTLTGPDGGCVGATLHCSASWFRLAEHWYSRGIMSPMMSVRFGILWI